MKGKTILISPMDWGLGHATRCVSLIRELERENRIIIGVTSLTRPIFAQEFPALEKVEVPSYNVHYSSWMPLWLKLLIAWPGMKNTIGSEKAGLAELLKIWKPDVVISDNRFGFYSNDVPSVFITHQLFLKTPFANNLIQSLNRKYILNFGEVWVPDYESEFISLSGELSHGKHFHPNVKYIGPQSRLRKVESNKPAYQVLFLLSGPEPQQSILGEKLIKMAARHPELTFAMVANSYKPSPLNNLDFYQSPGSEVLSRVISESEKIVCRSGYSTLMDLHLMDKKNLVLIPTPGQTEQQYLADYWQNKFSCRKAAQNDVKETNGINLFFDR